MQHFKVHFNGILQNCQEEKLCVHALRVLENNISKLPGIRITLYVIKDLVCNVYLQSDRLLIKKAGK